jgi:hypothetical protein
MPPAPWTEFTAAGADRIQRHLFLCADQTKPKCIQDHLVGGRVVEDYRIAE